MPRNASPTKPKILRPSHKRPEWFEAAEVIQAKLTALEAAGPAGFEGLMRDVLVELTDQPFFLAKSGPQGGSDVRSLPANFIRIGLEAKRYKKATALPLDQLKAKIIEAAHEVEPVDLWILAATREISVTDREGLRDVADRHGMKAIVWDWPGNGSVPPSLALALAAAPNAVSNYLGADASVQKALRNIAASPDYNKWLHRIIVELREPDVGYVAAASASKTWLDRAQGATGMALAHLRGHHDLKRPEVKLVRRTLISTWLQSWWTNGLTTAALLGGEGVGKTWAALSWWNDLSAAELPPLTVFLSAKDVQTNDPEDAIASALAKQTGLRDQAFWRRRLSHWKKAAPRLPILLILDGLNQNWMRRDWSDFLQLLIADDQRGRFRVLMTCWPTWWEELGALSPLHPAPLTLEVRGFSDEELKENFKQHGVPEGAFGKDLIELLRVPRLFNLALGYRVELAESGDVTAERLAYEDWKHRVKQGSARPNWSDDEFKELISALGKEFGSALETATISAKDLMGRIGAHSGADNNDLAMTVQDLVAGRWLQRVGGQHRYRISREMTPYVLGLALASELKGVTQRDAAITIIAEFVDPYRGQQLMVAILRAAATAVLLDVDVARHARAALVERWLHEQNFGETDFEAWWRLVGLDVQTFFSLAEEHWLYPEKSAGIAADEVLIKGFANSCQFSGVASKIRETTAKWLGWTWEDPDEGRFLGSVDSDTPRSKANRTRTLRNFSNWENRPDKNDWPLIELRTEGNTSWLAHRAVGILSFLPRAPQQAAFEAWAISRSIMEVPLHFDELAWVLRLNSEDQDNTRIMITDVVGRLLLVDDAITKRAAVWLLEALGDKESLDRAVALGTPWSSVQAPLLQDRALSLLDPNGTIVTPEDVPDGSVLWLFSMSQSDEDLSFDRIDSQLCRNDPSRLQTVFSAAARSAAARTDEQLTGLAKHVAKMVLLLPPDVRETFARELRHRADMQGAPKDTRQEWLRAAGILDLWGLSASGQWKRLKGDNFRAETLEGALPAVSHATDTDIQEIAVDLPDLSTFEIQHVALYFLLEANAAKVMSEWPALESLIFSESQTIRHRALRAASLSGNKAALRAFVNSDWATGADHSREENGNCSLALNAASDLFKEPELLDRSHSEIWGWRLQRGDESDLAFERFNAFIRDRVIEIGQAGHFSISESTWNQLAALELLVEKRPELVRDWLAPWLEAHERLPNFVMLQSFPLLDLAKALTKHGKPEGTILWTRLLEAEREGFCKNADLKFIPLYGRANIEQTLADSILSELITDDRLRDFAFFAEKNGHGAWLSKQIENDVMSSSAGRQARGWMLLGFSDASIEFQNLWLKLDQLRPNSGWLVNVVNLAQENYEKNRWARHWHDWLMTAPNALSVYAAFTLFSKTVDPRAKLWRPADGITKALRKNEIDAYWKLNQSQVNKVSKDAQNARKDRLFGISIMRHTQAPWI
jgi:hypothetical protein